MESKVSFGTIFSWSVMLMQQSLLVIKSNGVLEHCLKKIRSNPVQLCANFSVC